MEVKFTVKNKGSDFRDFEWWPLNRGWPLNTGPLNKDLTVNKQKNIGTWIELVAGCGKTIENPSHALIQSRNDVAIEANEQVQRNILAKPLAKQNLPIVESKSKILHIWSLYSVNFLIILTVLEARVKIGASTFQISSSFHLWMLWVLVKRS